MAFCRGRTTIEVRAFNADLTPAKKSVSMEVTISPAAEAQFVARVRDLASQDLDRRETAARMLKSQGTLALPKLRNARVAASPDQQWWIDAIIQHIEGEESRKPK